MGNTFLRSVLKVFVLEKRLYSGWYRKTIFSVKMLCNYCVTLLAHLL